MDDAVVRQRRKRATGPRQARLPPRIEDEPDHEPEPRGWRELLEEGTAALRERWPVIDRLGDRES